MSSLVAESERSPLVEWAGEARVKLGAVLVVALVLVAAGVFVVLQLAVPAVRPAVERTAVPASPAGVSKEQALAAYGKLPLAFVPNRGQIDARVRYSAHQAGLSVFFTRSEAVLALAKGKRGAALALRFLGASPTAIEGRHLGTGRINYLRGNDTRKWQTGLPTYGQVVYRNLWPGVDMVFRGAGGRLKYGFVVRPGAKVANIRLGYRGAQGLSVGRTGDLLVQTPLGVLRDERPRGYQEIGGKRVPVRSRFAPTGKSSFGFALGTGYDGRYPLVIDPGLVYSTFLGGSDDDAGRGIAVDTAGDAYVTGFTFSSNFPTTVGAFEPSFGGTIDAFVTKLDPTGSTLLYSTFLGGSSSDQGQAIALDAAGDTYLTGLTDSSDFPTSAGAFDSSQNGGSDAFVTKLNPTGSALVYSTFLGGASSDGGYGIAVDAGGHANVTGLTDASNFPTTPGAFDTSFNGNSDAFVTKLDAAGSTLLYSTFLGGSSSDQGQAIALDAAGDTYLTGLTDSSDFPTSAGAFDSSQNGGTDAFVTKLNPSGSTLLYSTFLGGPNPDDGRGIAVDTAGDAYVTGFTSSSKFPTTPGAFDRSQRGSSDAFVTKLNQTGSTLLYSTFLGGSSSDQGQGIALDAAGDAYLTGLTDSSDFPTSVGAFDSSENGGSDAFVTKLNPTGSALLYSTFLGGGSSDGGYGIALEPAGNAYVAGATDSSDFPTSVGAYDTTYNGGGDAFVTKLLPVVSTPSCEVTITNGGWIVADNGDRANFGGNAKVSADGSTVQGQEEYQDQGPARPFDLHSIALLAATCSSDLKSATIYGTARIDGSGTHAFRIDVTDMGSPGTNDSYGIIIPDIGYASGQHQLQAGNVTIHE